MLLDASPPASAENSRLESNTPRGEVFSLFGTNKLTCLSLRRYANRARTKFSSDWPIFLEKVVTAYLTGREYPEVYWHTLVVDPAIHLLPLPKPLATV